MDNSENKPKISTENDEEAALLDLEIEILQMWKMIKRLILEEERLSMKETEYFRLGGA